MFTASFSASLFSVSTFVSIAALAVLLMIEIWHASNSFTFAKLWPDDYVVSKSGVRHQPDKSYDTETRIRVFWLNYLNSSILFNSLAVHLGATQRKLNFKPSIACGLVVTLLTVTAIGEPTAMWSVALYSVALTAVAFVSTQAREAAKHVWFGSLQQLELLEIATAHAGADKMTLAS